MASILFWNSFLAAFMLAIMAPMFPTMEAKMRTPTRKSMVTNAYLRGYHLMSDAHDTGLENVKYKNQVLLPIHNKDTIFCSQIYKILHKMLRSHVRLM